MSTFFTRRRSRCFFCGLVPSAITPSKLETRPESISRSMAGNSKRFRRPSSSRFSAASSSSRALRAVAPLAGTEMRGRVLEKGLTGVMAKIATLLQGDAIDSERRRHPTDGDRQRPCDFARAGWSVLSDHTTVTTGWMHALLLCACSGLETRVAAPGAVRAC